LHGLGHFWGLVCLAAMGYDGICNWWVTNVGRFRIAFWYQACDSVNQLQALQKPRRMMLTGIWYSFGMGGIIESTKRFMVPCCSCANLIFGTGNCHEKHIMQMAIWPRLEDPLRSRSMDENWRSNMLFVNLRL
jgi:hypothetical protein